MFFNKFSASSFFYKLYFHGFITCFLTLLAMGSLLPSQFFFHPYLANFFFSLLCFLNTSLTACHLTRFSISHTHCMIHLTHLQGLVSTVMAPKCITPIKISLLNSTLIFPNPHWASLLGGSTDILSLLGPEHMSWLISCQTPNCFGCAFLTLVNKNSNFIGTKTKMCNNCCSLLSLLLHISNYCRL